LLNQSTIIEQPADLAKLTDKYVDYVDNFLKQRAAQGVQARQQQAAGTVEAEEEKPFLMYLAFNHVHVPNFCNDRFVGTSRRGPFGDSSTELDEAVGSVMDSLKKYGFDENTVVIYTSDNGPWLMQGLAGGSSGVFYEGKATTWEGGLRVPGFVRWKGVIEPRISMELSSTLDIFPTILSLAGVEQPQDRVIDGQDLTPLLFSKLASTKHTCLFLYKGTPMDEEHPGLWAVRCGPYKMHYISTNSWQSKHIVYDPPQLYNVETDPSESRPLDVTQYAKVLRQMEEQVAEHQLTLNQVPNQMGRGGNLQYRVCCDDQSQEHGLPQYPECTCSPGNWEHS
jgi:arylsulfatase A